MSFKAILHISFGIFFNLREVFIDPCFFMKQGIINCILKKHKLIISTFRNEKYLNYSIANGEVDIEGGMSMRV